MSTAMTAPSGGNFEKREKRSDIQLVPFGFQPVILYGIIDLGTQESEFVPGQIQKSHKIKFLFEFPLHKQLFYVDDTEFRPSVLSLEMAFQIYQNNKTGKKTKLLEMIESIHGPLRKEEHNTFDISQMLNKYYIANVVHYTKKDQTIGAKIQNIAAFQPQYYQNELNNGQLQLTNKLVLYSLSHGFESASFASMGYFDRKTVKASEQGIQHANRGGKFVKFDETGSNLVFDDAPAPVQQPSTTAQMYQQANQGYQQQQNYGQPQQPQQPAQQMPVQQQGYQAPATQAPANYQNGQQPQSAAQQFAQGGAPAQMAPQQQPAPAQAPQQPQQPQQVYQNAPAQPQGMQQPAQPMQPQGQPMAAATPAQQFAQGPGQPINPGAAPAQPQQPQAPAQGMAAPAGYNAGAPAQMAPQQQMTMAPQQQSMFEQQTSAHNPEDHDDLPF